MIKNFFLQIRPKQQLKNIIIFFPLIVDRNFTQENIVKLIPIYIAFTLSTVLVYTFNDFIDLQKDKINDVKKHRPLASGLLNKKQIFIFYIFVSIIMSVFLLEIDKNSKNLIFAYLFINFFYSLGLKKILYLEMALVASGYFIRLLIGMKYVQNQPTFYFFVSFISFVFLILVFKRYSEIKFGISNYRDYDLSSLKVLIIILINLNITSYLVYLGDLSITWVEIPRLLTGIFSVAALIFLNISLHQDAMKFRLHSPENYIFKVNYIVIILILFSTFFYTIS